MTSKTFPGKLGLIGLFILFAWQAGPAAFAQIPLLPIPTLVPTSLFSKQTSSAQPNIQQPTLSNQLLYLKAKGGAVGAESPSDSLFSLTVALPFDYTSGGTDPSYGAFDPQAEVFHSGPLAKGLLFTGTLGVDADIHTDNPGDNLNTLGGQLQLNFTNRGIHFKASPFIAYRFGFSVPADFSGHAWVNDFEVGYNFNGILGTGVSRGRNPLEIDFNPGLSQRLVQIDDGQGGQSTGGSSALEFEFPVIYKFNSNFDMLLDLTAYTRYYDVNQDPADQKRLDEALSFPLILEWTVVPDWGLQLSAQESFTRQFSSVPDEDWAQWDTGVVLEERF